MMKVSMWVDLMLIIIYLFPHTIFAKNIIGFSPFTSQDEEETDIEDIEPQVCFPSVPSLCG